MQKEFRRKAPRRTYDSPVGILYRGKMSFTPCLQIGEGGALIAQLPGPNPIQEGESIVITIFFPVIGGVVSTAECVYFSEDNTVGLSFVDLGMDFKKKIREFVSRRKTIEAA